MTRWLGWTSIALACGASALVGALVGVALVVNAYGGGRERAIERLAEQARVLELAQRDGASAQGELVRTMLPAVQQATAEAVLLGSAGLGATYAALLRASLAKLDANPLVRGDAGAWAAAAQAARSCALTHVDAQWGACIVPVKAAQPRRSPHGQAAAGG